MIRTLIADDHAIFRDGLRRLLEAEPDMEVAGEAGDGREAVDLVFELRPDVLLLDLAMPRLHGFDALRELSGTSLVRPLAVVVLTATVDARDSATALRLGARGVVTKTAASDALLASIRSVAGGGYWVDREAVPDLTEALARLGTRPGSSNDFGLTPREVEIIAAVVAGRSNREIARQFMLSEQTVKHHLTSIFDKTGANSRLELALFALQHGLVAG